MLGFIWQEKTLWLEEKKNELCLQNSSAWRWRRPRGDGNSRTKKDSKAQETIPPGLAGTMAYLGRQRRPWETG